MTLLSFLRKKYSLDAITTFFLFLYSLRLIYDSTYGSKPEAVESTIFYLIAVVLPFVSISLSRAYYNETRSLIAMVIVCLPSMLVLVLAGQDASDVSTTGRFGFESLNPVSIGYLGLYAFMAAVFLWPHVKKFYCITVLAPSIMLGGYFMIIASARGPILGLALCLIALGIRKGWTLLIVSSFFVFGALVFGDNLTGLPIIDRIAATGNDLSSIHRFERIEIALDLMIKYPYFGYAYIDPVYDSFPHNLIIESGMALGIGGFLFMIFLQIRYARLIWLFLRQRQYYVPMMGIIGLSSAWMSSTLWASVTFWTPFILLMALQAQPFSKRRRKHKNN